MDSLVVILFGSLRFRDLVLRGCGVGVDWRVVEAGNIYEVLRNDNNRNRCAGIFLGKAIPKQLAYLNEKMYPSVLG